MKRRNFLLTGFGGLLQNARGQSETARGGAIRVVLSERGFEPRQINLKPGPVNLIVRSRLAGQADFDVVEVGKSESKLADALGKRKSRTALTGKTSFAVGTYEIRDPRFPQWKCTLNVRP
jgi:hypothetical protein